MHITKGNKPIWKGYIIYDSNPMTSGKNKAMETVNRSVVVGGWRRERKRRTGRAEGIFRAAEIFCLIF